MKKIVLLAIFASTRGYGKDTFGPNNNFHNNNPPEFRGLSVEKVEEIRNKKRRASDSKQGVKVLPQTSYPVALLSFLTAFTTLGLGVWYWMSNYKRQKVLINSKKRKAKQSRVRQKVLINSKKRKAKHSRVRKKIPINSKKGKTKRSILPKKN